MENDVKIACGMIVCNGVSFVKECIQNIYPYVDSIHIAEGASRQWCDAHRWASPRSNDGTIDAIHDVRDPDNKIDLISSEHPYEDKNHQSNHWMRRVPDDTDYVWMVDCDELYMPNDMIRIRTLLEYQLERGDPITQMSFPLHHFFKNIHTEACGGEGWGWDVSAPRIFAYKPGRLFHGHRPPTVLDENGVNLRDISHVDCRDMGIWIFHYSYVTHRQVLEKMKYYENVFKRPYVSEWYYKVWLPWNDDTKNEIESCYSIHPTERGGYTRPFYGEHPPEIMKSYNS